MKLKKYASAKAAMAALQARGYDRRFQLTDQQLQDIDNLQTYTPADLVMVEHHRFQHPQHWQDTLIIVALEDHLGNKGLVVSKYGQAPHMKLISFIDQVKMKSSVPATVSSKSQ